MVGEATICFGAFYALMLLIVGPSALTWPTGRDPISPVTVAMFIVAGWVLRYYADRHDALTATSCFGLLWIGLLTVLGGDSQLPGGFVPPSLGSFAAFGLIGAAGISQVLNGSQMDRALYGGAAAIGATCILGHLTGHREFLFEIPDHSVAMDLPTSLVVFCIGVAGALPRTHTGRRHVLLSEKGGGAQ